MPEYGYYVNRLGELNDTLERREEYEPLVEVQERLVNKELRNRTESSSLMEPDDDTFVMAVKTVRPDVPEDVIYEILDRPAEPPAD